MKPRNLISCSILLALAALASARGSAGELENNVPTEHDWQQAQEAPLDRQMHSECRATRLSGVGGAEWMRVTCAGSVGYLESRVIIASGPVHDVNVALANNWIQVTFPMRRGERRVFLAGTAIGISAVWLREDAKPTVVID